jgi:hypothetical protein
MPAAPTISYSAFGFLREKMGFAKEAWESWSRQRIQRTGLVRVHTPWQLYWGEAYGLELKKWLLKPVFDELERTGKVGDLIVDVGSGAQPVTRFLDTKPNRKRILVDVAAESGGREDEARIRLDAEKIGEMGMLSFRKALVRACRFVGIAPGVGNAGADTMVFADLLNYVDFRKVLSGFASYLKPGGRFVIVNLPMRGNQALFSDKGLKDNRLLYEWLESERFEIEQKSFPCRARNATEEAEELIVLIARKGA